METVRFDEHIQTCSGHIVFQCLAYIRKEETCASGDYLKLPRLKAKAPLTVRDARGQSLLHVTWTNETGREVSKHVL